MELLVTDRIGICSGILVRSTYVIVSIHDPDKPPPRVKKTSGLRGVLRLAFHDAKPTEGFRLPDGVVPPNRDHGERLCAFLKLHWNDIGAVVVHCEQGMSRSPAVAAAITYATGGDPSRFFEEYAPNMYVFELMCQCLRGLK